jgi:hypothetical protein
LPSQRGSDCSPLAGGTTHIFPGHDTNGCADKRYRRCTREAAISTLIEDPLGLAVFGGPFIGHLAC